MRNRVDATLSPADIQNLKDAFETIKNKIGFRQTLIDKERRKGGWYLSSNALLLAELALSQAKHAPANFPKIDAAEFERDVKLIKELANLESQVLNLQYMLKDTRRMLTVDTTEQCSYVYAMLKIFYEQGIPGGEAFPTLKERMPRSGKKATPKKTDAPT